ncbi:MAG: methyltransferase domain-containing protein [Cyclobacteriaceae bacterium]
MNSDLWQHFSNHPEFKLKDGLFSFHDAAPSSSFEEQYLQLRSKEGRYYSDEIIKILPDVPSTHLLRKEWAIRRSSAHKLARWLKKQGPTTPTILDIGCGNGWLGNYLSNHFPAVYCGLDVNKAELEQAARLFTRDQQIFFVYADISIIQLPKGQIDFIILASSVQYFNNLKWLITKLLSLLAPKGEIHIVDSPMYSITEASNARERTRKYFEEKGFGKMNDWYHHHTWPDLESFQFEILSKPSHRIIRWISNGSSTPFPWIKITA